MTLAVSADKPIRDITEYADKTLRRQLESVNGVGQVVVVGGRQRQVNITLDPGAPAGAEPDGDRRLARAAGAERGDPRRPRRGRRAVDDAAHPRPRAVGRRSSATSSSRERDGHPILLRDVGGDRGRHGRRDHARQRQRQADRAALDPPPVRRQHRADGRRGQGAARRHQGGHAARATRSSSSATCPSSSARRSTPSKSTSCSARSSPRSSCWSSSGTGARR